MALRDDLKNYIPMYLWEVLNRPEGYVVTAEEFNEIWNKIRLQNDTQADVIRDILNMLYETVLDDTDGASHIRVDLPAYVADNLKTVLELIDQRLTADAQALATHKTSDDHDHKYYTEAELDEGKLDNRYFTEAELQATADGSSGANKIGITPISSSPADVQGALEWLKTQLDAFVLDQIPDGSLTDAKLSDAPGQMKDKVNAIDAAFDDHIADFNADKQALVDHATLEATQNGLGHIKVDGKTAILDEDGVLKIVSPVQITEEVIDFNEEGIVVSTDGVVVFDGSIALAKTYDLDVATYSKSFYVGSQESMPQGVSFNNDGTKMYVVGTSSDSVYEYNLSTPFDIGTAVYSKFFSVSAQDTTPMGMAWNNDGSKMYVVGFTGQDINEYNLSTPFDIGTAVYSKSFSVATQETVPTYMAWNNNGSKMYVIGPNSKNVHEYNLSTPFDIATSVYSKSFSVAGQDTTPRGVAFNNDGSKMYVTGHTGQDINEYNLSTPFDVGTAVYSKVFSVSAQDTQPQGIAWNNNGSKMYVSGATGKNIHEYTTFTLASGTEGSATIAWKDQPTDLKAWDLATYQNTLDGESVSVDVEEGELVPDYYNIHGLSYSKSFSVAAQEATPSEMSFNNDGTKMYVVGTTNDSVYEYNLSTPFDIGTAVYSKSFNVAAQETVPQGMAFNNDGSKMYVTGLVGKSVYEYNLSTPFDIGTAVYSKSFNVAAQDTNPQGMAFNNDGSKMYVIGSTNDSVHEYNLSTPFDIGTAVYSKSFSVATQETVPQGVSFNNDGTKMYVVGSTGKNIHEYDLSTPFDIATAVYPKVFSVVTQETSPTGMAWNNDGSKMYVIGNVNDSVYEYHVGTKTKWTPVFTNIGQNFDISTIDTGKFVRFKVNLSRVSTTNRPSCDYLARRFVR